MPCEPGQRLASGQRAEDAAARFLERRGLRVVLRNHRCRGGELDLVARDAGDLLVIAEVRLRSSEDFGGAAASVDHAKRRRIVHAARHLLARRPEFARCRVRFDVIAVSPLPAAYGMRWIRGAFDAG
jgi:putative endonuclease